jgi:hypothetical protein
MGGLSARSSDCRSARSKTTPAVKPTKNRTSTSWCFSGARRTRRGRATDVGGLLGFELLLPIAPVVMTEAEASGAAAVAAPLRRSSASPQTRSDPVQEVRRRRTSRVASLGMRGAAVHEVPRRRTSRTAAPGRASAALGGASAALGRRSASFLAGCAPVHEVGRRQTFGIASLGKGRASLRRTGAALGRPRAAVRKVRRRRTSRIASLAKACASERRPRAALERSSAAVREVRRRRSSRVASLATACGAPGSPRTALFRPSGAPERTVDGTEIKAYAGIPWTGPFREVEGVISNLLGRWDGGTSTTRRPPAYTREIAQQPSTPSLLQVRPAVPASHRPT